MPFPILIMHIEVIWNCSEVKVLSNGHMKNTFRLQPLLLEALYLPGGDDKHTHTNTHTNTNATTTTTTHDNDNNTSWRGLQPPWPTRSPPAPRPRRPSVYIYIYNHSQLPLYLLLLSSLLPAPRPRHIIIIIIMCIKHCYIITAIHVFVLMIVLSITPLHTLSTPRPLANPASAASHQAPPQQFLGLPVNCFSLPLVDPLPKGNCWLFAACRREDHNSFN